METFETLDRHFTVIAYDTIDFLIPSSYIASGVYLSVEKTAKNLVFNRETLPYMHVGNLLEKEFKCASNENYDVVLVFQSADFAPDVQKSIIDYTETAFPASGYLALSVNGAVSSYLISLEKLRLIPNGVRGRMNECGVNAISFTDEGRLQLVVSPDVILRKFFFNDLRKKRGISVTGTGKLQ